jgi:hypothetical protein
VPPPTAVFRSSRREILPVNIVPTNFSAIVPAYFPAAADRSSSVTVYHPPALKLTAKVLHTARC